MLEVSRFEWVPGPGSTLLVRLTGRWLGAPPSAMPCLMAGAVSISALPDPARPKSELRAAYAVPRHLVESPATAYALQLVDGAGVELPRPARGQTPLERALGEAECVRADLVNVQDQIDIVREAATTRERAHRDQLHELQTELTAAREHAARVEAERDGLRRKELAPDGRVALERRHAAEVEDLERRLRRSEAALQRARREIAEDLRGLGSEAAVLERELETLRGDVALVERVAL